MAAHTRGLAAAVLVCTLVAAATTSFGASSNIVVSMSVPSAIQITNGCSSTTATSFGTVLPGTGATTDTGAGRCIVSWGASNDSSMLRLAQRDGVGTAMSKPAGYTGPAVDWNHWTSVDTADGSNVVAGGDGGNFARSANSGGTWTVTGGLGGINSEISDVDQVPSDATVAWVVGYSGRVQRVTNALGVPVATNRRTQLEAAGWPAWADVTDVAVYDTDTVFVGGDGGWVAKTDDNGLNWTAYQMPSTSSISALSLAPTGHIWMATRNNPGGNLFRVLGTGGGTAASWTQYPNGVGISISDVQVTGAANGYAVGGSGAIYSWDGAAWSWRGDDLVEPNGLTSVASPAGVPGTAVAVGWDGSIIRSVNGGLNWTRVSSPVGGGLTAMASGTAGMIAVGTSRTSITSTDGAGATWVYQSDSITGRGRRNIALEPVDGTVALAVGTRGTVWRSTDGGATWGVIATPTTEALFGVTWASRTIAWAVGSGGTMIRSTDAGLTWSTVTSGTSQRLLSVSAGEADQVVAVGDAGTVVTSVNGGTTFTVSTVGGGKQLQDVSMGSRTVGVLVAANLVLRTTNGGLTWTVPTTTPGTDRMFAVSMANATTGYAITTWDWVWKTTDGGDTWTASNAGVGSAVDIHAVTANVAFVVAGSNVWTTINGGTSWSQATGSSSWGKASVTAGDEHHVIVGGDVGAVAVRKASTAGADQIPDYGVAPNSWAASAQAMFGVCLQAVGAQTTQAAPWVVDGGTCTGSDADPWRALPTAPTKIAGVPIAGNTGQVELVWGARFPDAQAPGRYSAGVVFEAVAPNA